MDTRNEELITLGYQVFGSATFATHIFLVVLIALILSVRFIKPDNRPEVITQLSEWIATRTYLIILAATGIATLGSLYFSDIAGFAPCVLCWWQRIAMYPQPVLIYTALMRNETVLLKPYLILLNGIGAAISAYHNIILLIPKADVFTCGTKGGASCIQGYTYFMDYITLPLMALTVFVINIILLVFYATTPSSKKTTRKSKVN